MVNKLFVPSTQQPSVLYWRLSDFCSSWTTLHSCAKKVAVKIYHIDKPASIKIFHGCLIQEWLKFEGVDYSQNLPHPQIVIHCWINVEIQIYSLHKGAFTYDVRCFLGSFDLPTYPNQILYYISLFSKIRWSYLPKNLTSYMNAPLLFKDFYLNGLQLSQ